jgi:uncharacterized protein (TIGR02246 family)
MPMTFAKTLLAATLLAGVPFAANAQMQPLSDPVVAHPDPESLFTSEDPQLHRNKQAALHIMRELLQCNQWERAGEWLTDAYIQHNPLAASGLEGVQNYFINIAKRQPTPTCDKLTSPVVAVQAEGDFVNVMLVRELPIPGDPEGDTYTTTWFDAWRFVDGKADEHWDPATLPEAPPPQASAAAADPMAERVAIEQLMWDYVRAADTLNAVAYAALFTEDGSFNQVRGRAALRDMISGMESAQAERRESGALAGNMHHIMSNQTIEMLGPDKARVHYYWQTVFGGPGIEPTPRVAAVGNGVDDVVKTDGRWLIASRNVQPTLAQE